MNANEGENAETKSAPGTGRSTEFIRGPVADNPEIDFQTQRVWFDLVRRSNWRSLAIVPASAEVDVQPIAFDFARLAAMQPDSRILLVDGGSQNPTMPLPSNVQRTKTRRFADKELLEEFLPTLEAELQSGHAGTSQVLIAATFLWEKASTIPLVRAADAWVLAVTLGQTKYGEAKETLDLLDRETLLGSVIVAPKKSL